MSEQKLYNWDKAFFEKRLNLFSNAQFSCIGAALMLMMMDLTKPYLLAPLIVGLIMASWLKHHYSKVSDNFLNSSVSFSPKSLLISQPKLESETRITFRQIKEVSLKQDNFIPVLVIEIDESAEEEDIELVGFEKPELFLTQLETAINEQREAVSE